MAYGFKTTAMEAALAHAEYATGRVALITGANSGIGFETARALAAAGMVVFVACRTKTKSNHTIDKIKAEFPDADLRPLDLDLAKLSSVRQAAAEFLQFNMPLHVLVNNAGVMATPKLRTEDGLELQFGVNHIGHFLLTTLLLERIKSSAPARIINVSSFGNVFCYPQGIPFDDLDAQRHYGRWRRYGVSKLCNILFSKELQRQFDAEGVDVKAVSLHPGQIQTNLTRYFSSSVRVLEKLYGLAFYKSIGQGAATSVICALQPDIVGGAFYLDCQEDKHPGKNQHAKASDVDMAKRLWTTSEELVANIN